MERNTRAPETMKWKKSDSERPFTFQSHVEVTCYTAPPPEDEWITIRTSTLQSLYQEISSLKKSLESMKISMCLHRQTSEAQLKGIMSKVEKAVQESWTGRNLAELERKLGETVERKTARALQAFQEKVERILSEKLDTLQSHVEADHRAASSSEEPNSTLISTLQILSQEVRSLKRSLEIMKVLHMQHDRQHSAALPEGIMSKQEKIDPVLVSWFKKNETELEKKLGKALERNTTRTLETIQKVEHIWSEKLATLQRHVEAANHSTSAPKEETITSTLQKLSQQVQAVQTSLESMKASLQHDHQHSTAKLGVLYLGEKKAVQECRTDRSMAELESKLEFAKIQRYSVDVILDADTAHPLLKVLPDGKAVEGTDKIRNVPRTEKRFDSHLFVLAKEGYTSGKRYWEVDVGEKRNWEVGIARETVTRKGTLTLSPEKGFWVIGLMEGREYWARSVPWTRLAVSGKLTRIGIFLDITAKKLSFFNVHKETVLHTFSLGGDKSQEGKFFPFFSVGTISAKPDTEPLKIVQRFDE